MFVPVILGSDKTTVSVATGHTEYYPLYAAIGNTHNGLRRAHRNALVLIAFLAIPKSMFIPCIPIGHLIICYS
jgi:Plavaka transposase